MARKQDKRWISPIGQSVSEHLAEQLEADPKFRALWERNRPYREIAAQVILRRGELGLSQAQLARRMGTTKSGISRIESGRHRTSLLTLEKLAAALEMQLDIGFAPKPVKRASRRPAGKRPAGRSSRIAA